MPRSETNRRTRMAIFDVFNGDADGICALIQYRLAHPETSTLITGVKRDIKLLDQVSVVRGDQVNVFDISMQKNSAALQRLLEDGASVFYVDHHLSGDLPDHSGLQAIIDTSPTTCTSLLVDHYLKGKHKEWAIVAAFGDNMLASAEREASLISLDSICVNQLKKLGVSINYNGYGSCLTDLHFPPNQLYQQMVVYKSPFDFINDPQSVYRQLQDGYDSDMAKTNDLEPEKNRVSEYTALYKLPDEGWARRVSGVFGNQLSNQYPDRAHAILTDHPDGGYRVSIRAPQSNLDYAGELCGQFDTGGGRKGAAGINQLPKKEFDRFVTLFRKTYQ